MLVSGSLSAAGAMWNLSNPGAAGFTPAHVCGLASLLPLVTVLRTYLVLARETDSAALRKSGLGLFGTLILLELLNLHELTGMPAWWPLLVWAAEGVGLIGLLIYTFNSGKSKDTKADGISASKAGWGGVAFLLFLALKVGLKGLVIVGARNLNQSSLVALVWIALQASAVIFTLWFAITKMRLAGRLGALAALLGVIEIAILATVIGVNVGYFAALSRAEANRVDADKARDKVETEWKEIGHEADLGINVVWSLATALWFFALRGRYEPHTEWMRDLEQAEAMDEYRS